jgi:hypothetical protein
MISDNTIETITLDTAVAFGTIVAFLFLSS